MSDASREKTGRCEHWCRGRHDAAKAQHAAAISRVVAVLLRGRFALVRAAVRAADAVDRVQGREHDQYRHCQEPSHDSIMACFPPVLAVEAINLGLDTSVFGLVMDPFRPKTLYASGPSGVYKTLTGGEEK